MVPKSPSWRLSNVKSDNEQVLIQKSGSENSASVPDDISFFCLQQDIRREIQWFQVEK
jgi:hypothetical protein